MSELLLKSCNNVWIEGQPKRFHPKVPCFQVSRSLTETPHHWQRIPARHSADQQVFLHSRHFELPARFPSLQWWYCTTGACNKNTQVYNTRHYEKQSTLYCLLFKHSICLSLPLPFCSRPSDCLSAYLHISVSTSNAIQADIFNKHTTGSCPEALVFSVKVEQYQLYIWLQTTKLLLESNWSKKSYKFRNTSINNAVQIGTLS